MESFWEEPSSKIVGLVETIGVSDCSTDSFSGFMIYDDVASVCLSVVDLETAGYYRAKF